MFEQIKFMNHINEVMEWGKNGIFVNYNDLHDYSWDFTSDNNKISSFKMGIVKKTIPIIIVRPAAHVSNRCKSGVRPVVGRT